MEGCVQGSCNNSSFPPSIAVHLRKLLASSLSPGLAATFREPEPWLGPSHWSGGIQRKKRFVSLLPREDLRVNQFLGT